MALLDTTIVNVALPSVQSGLGAGSSQLEWVVSGYMLALGLTLIPAGRIGDRIGHHRMYVAGLTLFTLASLACGLAQSPGQLDRRPGSCRVSAPARSSRPSPR